MHRLFNVLILVMLPLTAAAEPLNETRFAAPPALLDFTVNSLSGDARNLAAYYGKPMLVVNVASACGLTPQYAGLQSLHETYATKGLAVVAFPCNDFGAQEPGTHADIAAFCKTRFGVKFDMMEKIQVAPGKRHPFYEKLLADTGEPNKIRWNFEKFLIGRDGTVAQRFAPKVKPNDPALIAAIETALAAPTPEPLAYTHYLGRRVAHTMHWKAADWLTRTEREREEATSVMLKELRLTPGMVVADVGCGNGYHALPMAESVAPDGKVIGSDIQPEMLDFLKARAATENITNIETVSGTLTSPELPSGKVDRILLVDAYHEFSHPPQMLAAMRDALAPGGQIVLLEFRTEDPKIPIKVDHKMSKKQIIKELNANGFRLARSFDELPWQHMLFFERAE